MATLLWRIKGNSNLLTLQRFSHSRIALLKANNIRAKSAAVTNADVSKVNEYVGATSASSWQSPSSTSTFADPAFAKIDVNFENAKEAFKSKTNGQLMRALLVLNLCSFKYLVEHNKQVYTVHVLHFNVFISN